MALELGRPGPSDDAGDKADRYDVAVDSLIAKRVTCPNPRCGARLGHHEAGELDCSEYPPLLAFACSCGATCKVPIF